MKSTIFSFLLIALFYSSGCATYSMSRNVKMLSYDEDASKGKSLGPVTGESCQWRVMGYSVSSSASLDAALGDARTKASGARYLNNVSTDRDGFDAKVVAKDCMIVKGVAYR